MILIHKSKEPKELSDFKKLSPTENSNDYYRYEDNPPEFSKAKEVIENILLKDQFYLCAYCMRKIDLNKNEAHRIEDRVDKIRIEHWHSQTWSRQNKDREDLNYSNMLGVCDGLIDGEKYCEGKPRGSDMLVVNPLDKNLMRQIKYTGNGTIYIYTQKSEEKEYFDNFKKCHKELIKSPKKEQEKFDEIQNYNQIEKLIAIEYDLNETLKLNNEKIRDLRIRLWNRTIKEIENKNKPIPISILEEKKSEWEKSVDGKKRPFLGFILYRLNRMIENYKINNQQ